MASVAAKRAFDLVVAAVGLVALAPILALIGWRIARDSRGPVLYTQLRTGRYRRPFHIVKFRTMVVDAEARLAQVRPRNLHADQRLYKISDDPRVTPVGVLLRRHSLDELPQLGIGQRAVPGGHRRSVAADLRRAADQFMNPAAHRDDFPFSSCRAHHGTQASSLYR